MHVPAEKRCYKCHQIKPLTEFHRRKRSRDGHTEDCKTCACAKAQQWITDHREEAYEKRRTKYRTNLEDSRAKERERYHTKRRPQRLVYMRTRRKNFPEVIAAIAHRAYMNHRAERLAQARQYVLNHFDAVKRYKDEHRRLNWPRYLLLASIRTKRNWPTILARQQRRRVKRSGGLIGDIFTTEDIAIRDRWMCHICHRKVTRGEESLDHLIPVSQGGEHTRENVSLAHRRCNSRRGAGRIPAQLRLLP